MEAIETADRGDIHSGAETQTSDLQNPYSELRECNSSYIDDSGNFCKADDNGKTYEVNGECLPNSTYELNDSQYTTDEKGRIVQCNAEPQMTPENPRDFEAQIASGGADRKPGDQGGHIVGRDMGGDGGTGNLVPMDSRINQSDYKRMENDMKKALSEGSAVSMETNITYSGDSKRPDKIVSTVKMDGKETAYTFDNNLDGSLMDDLEKNCSESDIKNVKEVLDDTNGQISSIKETHADDGNLEQTSVSMTYVGEDGKNYRTIIVINHSGGTEQ